MYWYHVEYVLNYKIYSLYYYYSTITSLWMKKHALVILEHALTLMKGTGPNPHKLSTSLGFSCFSTLRKSTNSIATASFSKGFPLIWEKSGSKKQQSSSIPTSMMRMSLCNFSLSGCICILLSTAYTRIHLPKIAAPSLLNPLLRSSLPRLKAYMRIDLPLQGVWKLMLHQLELSAWVFTWLPTKLGKKCSRYRISLTKKDSHYFKAWLKKLTKVLNL